MGSLRQMNPAKYDWFRQHPSWPRYKHLIEQLAAYASGNEWVCEKLGIDPTRGLMLLGDVGCGKTTLLRLLRRLPTFNARWVSCLTVAEGVVSHGASIMNNYCVKADYVFDDLGQEQKRILSYGSEIFPMRQVLTHRYELFVNFGSKTHITTNMVISDNLEYCDFDQRYSKRIRDRVSEMFNVIDMHEFPSLRSSTSIPGAFNCPRTILEPRSEVPKGEYTTEQLEQKMQAWYADFCQSGEYTEPALSTEYYERLKARNILRHSEGTWDECFAGHLKELRDNELLMGVFRPDMTRLQRIAATKTRRDLLRRTVGQLAGKGQLHLFEPNPTDHEKQPATNPERSPASLEAVAEG
jgi:hypothetical protein